MLTPKKGKIMTNRRKLPPGQVEIKKIAIRHIKEIPEIDSKIWRLIVSGKVEKTHLLTMEDVLALPTIVSVSDFHCVEGWSVLNNTWEGFSFKPIINMVRPKKDAKYVIFECADGYSTSLPLTELLKKDVLLAYKLNGIMLKPKHGGPLRLIIPHKYAYKSAMWINKITFTDENVLGFWEERGYSDTADPWKEDRYTE